MTNIRSTCWHGDRDDLQRLVDLVAQLQAEAATGLQRLHAAKREADDNAHQQRVEAAIDSFKDDLKEHRVDYLRSLLRSSAADFSRISEKQEMEDMELSMEVLYRAFDTRDSGAPEDVMSRLNVKEVKAVTLTYGRVWDHTVNGMRIRLKPEGVSADIAGEEFFVNGSANRLKEAFRQQRPRSWWLRSGWFLGPFAALVTLGTMAIIGSLFLPPDMHSALLALFSASTAFLSLAVWHGVRWLVPSFEFIPQGRKSRSQWAWGAIGGITLSLVASAIWLIVAPDRG